MSFNINFQKTNKTSAYPDRMVVRRFWYCKEEKKQKSKTIFTSNKHSAPFILPDDVIAKHDVTSQEAEQYNSFMLDLFKKKAEDSISLDLKVITMKMKQLEEVLKERSDGVTLSEIDEFNEVLPAFRKQLARHKRNAQKRGDEALAIKLAEEQGQGDLIDTIEGEK